jgi:hypothetical protein
MQVGASPNMEMVPPNSRHQQDLLEAGHPTSPHANIDISRDPDDKHLLEPGQVSPGRRNQEMDNLNNIGMDGPRGMEYATGVRSRESC